MRSVRDNEKSQDLGNLREYEDPGARVLEKEKTELRVPFVILIEVQVARLLQVTDHPRRANKRTNDRGQYLNAEDVQDLPVGDAHDIGRFVRGSRRVHLNL